MDPITHGLLGANIGYAVCGKKINKHAWRVGALSSMAPDLDILIQSKHNPFLLYEFHRDFTHSLVFIPIIGIIVGLFYLLICKSSRINWQYVILAAIVAAATHGILDTCTSYGTVLLWPFSNERLAWDIIAIIDPIVTGILLISLLIALRKQSPLIAAFGVVVTICYLMLGVWQHERGIKLQTTWAAEQHHVIVRQRVMPTVGQLYYWHGIYQSGQKIYFTSILLLPFLQPEISTKIAAPLFSATQLPNSVTKNPLQWHDFKIFNWFSDDYLVVANSSPLTLCDALYTQYQPSIRCIWAIQFPDVVDAQHLLLKKFEPIAEHQL
jgi:inner membrane protein